MESKIPYYRFRGEEYDKDGDVFGEMRAVSIEYLQCMSKNYYLDAIPMVWLYDWAKVNGLDGYKDVQDWLTSLKERRERPRPLQIPQKKNAIVYKGCIDRRNKYYLKFRGWYKECELYNGFCFVGGKRFTLTDEQMSRFHKVYRKFNDDLEKAKNNQEEFHCVEKDGMIVYFRRLPNLEYQFITKFANGEIRQDKMIIKSWCVQFNFLGLEKIDSRLWCSVRDIPPIDDDFILLDTDDEYLNKEIKYLCHKATKEDMEYLTSIDGFSRLYVDKEIYGVRDIVVTKVDRLPQDYIHSIRYKIYFTFEGKEYTSCDYYYREDNEIYASCHAKPVKIQITKELKGVIDKMIEELP